MDDYWPTLLELTPPAAPWTGAAAAVLDTLESGYRATLLSPDRGDAGSTLRLAGKTVGFELRADADGGPLALRLDSTAYAGAFDVMRQQVRRKGLDALMRLCVDLAAAARAEGFRLRFDNATALPSPGVRELVNGFVSVDGEPGMIAGISASSTQWPTVRSFWPDWITMDGYQVKEFLS